jgi:mono/diheme cytochrome c family protein
MLDGKAPHSGMTATVLSAAMCSLTAIGACGYIVSGQAAPALEASVAVADQSTRSARDGVYTSPQAKRGAVISARECASCHGEALEGSDGPALTGEDFLASWNGQNAGDLFERIRGTMPATTPGNLSSQEYADVLALILSLNNFPAGTTELPSEVALLKQILIEAAREGSMPPH